MKFNIIWSLDQKKPQKRQLTSSIPGRLTAKFDSTHVNGHNTEIKEQIMTIPEEILLNSSAVSVSCRVFSRPAVQKYGVASGPRLNC